ncbi:hypothetical protein B0H10DRAFT_1810082 [Mycena sp. CBHHK59/15]|nr:hypothetical protein B0H10DRAFT_1810082 [Mycena sp. CBHHK59/15]
MILSLPEPCKTILKTAHEFNVRLDALNVDNELKCSLPIWFHPAADKNLNYLNNSRPSKCLRTFHSVRTVGDLMAITTGDNLRHSRRKNCACPTCKYDRNLSCIGPYACRDEAHKLLDCLHLKWDPRCELHQPNPALTTEELLENKQAFDQKEPVIFDPNITMKLSIALGFQVFVNKPRSKHPADQMPQTNNNLIIERTICIAGAFSMTSAGEPCASGGAWLSPDNPRNRAIGVPCEQTT